MPDHYKFYLKQRNFGSLASLRLMAVFFFNLSECGVRSEDDEGRDVDPGSIAEVAADEARAVMASEVRQGRLCLGCKIEVLDANHHLVLTVPFQKALTITGLIADDQTDS